jgi:hypothetical protein
MKADAPLSPSPPPALAGHQYFAASRPVVGTVATSSLLLFVCSWFAIGNGSLWPSRDVGTPDPVRIDVPSRPDAAVGIAVSPRAAAHTAATRSRHELVGQRGTSANPTAPTRIGPEGAAAQKPASAATATPTQPPALAPSPTPAPATDQPQLIVETPQLPAQVDGLPEASVTVPVPQLPSVTLPVTPPSLPKVPVVSDVTATVGLP